MRKNDAILIGILIASNLVTPILGQVLKGADPIVKILVQVLISVGLLSILIVKTKMLQWEASAYDIFRVMLDPPGTMIDIPVRRGWKRETKQNPKAPWLNVTTVDFAYEMKIPGHEEKVARAHIAHFDAITNRLESTFQENVSYKGDEIEHNTVYLMTLWKNDMYPVSQEESREEPNWILISAVRADRSDNKMKNRTLSMALALDKKFSWLLGKQPKSVKQYIQKLELENEILLKNHVEDTSYITPLVGAVEHYRISDINKDGKLDSANQEITGMIDDTLTVKKASQKINSSEIDSIDDVYDLGNRDKWYNKLELKWIAIVLIAIIGIGYLWGNPELISQITGNTTNLIVIAIIVGIVAYMIYYLKPTLLGDK